MAESIKTGKDKKNVTEAKKLKKRYEISACIFLFGVAMIVIGVFL